MTLPSGIPIDELDPGLRRWLAALDPPAGALDETMLDGAASARPIRT
jgi:hypothetical protein